MFQPTYEAMFQLDPLYFGKIGEAEWSRVGWIFNQGIKSENSDKDYCVWERFGGSLSEQYVIEKYG